MSWRWSLRTRKPSDAKQHLAKTVAEKTCRIKYSFIFGGSLIGVCCGQADLPKLYSGHDAFLFTSRYEAWGMPVLEAFASGLAVVATSCQGVNTFAQHGVNCLLAQPLVCSCHSLNTVGALAKWVADPQPMLSHEWSGRVWKYMGSAPQLHSAREPGRYIYFSFES